MSEQLIEAGDLAAIRFYWECLLDGSIDGTTMGQYELAARVGLALLGAMTADADKLAATERERDEARAERDALLSYKAAWEEVPGDCPYCSGRGVVIVPRHDPRCDGSCDCGLCPIPSQERCSECNGTGNIKSAIARRCGIGETEKEEG